MEWNSFLNPGTVHTDDKVECRSDFRQKSIPATKSTVADKFDFVADTVDFVADLSRFWRQIGDNLNIYESRDDPFTSDVISIQSTSTIFSNFGCYFNKRLLA